ncbi:endo-1,4-beta-xylanase, putative [Talaromyces stipitatus ATCC 10500]|uniref:Beta-xylanase n=1 Tax=Talaromyces stipitatus (strain ATCC 10500 / CBS 375.48 / QM 6759 / NRRL 1006) TaxID=441959 RepID=B8MH80_TALSN|nr:endo-1,4-beta-xylanase, putative [Talaromyces stipitatus ATCC 10500]EED16894.1 endo-1,4-beta-xylanase, putative [Talaromyces stipitatus ATCC 10500]
MVAVKPLILALAAGHLAHAQLNTAAKAAGLLYFGTAVDNGDLSDSQYLPNLETDDFGQITPANSMKWQPTEPSQGSYTFSQGDQIASLAKTNNDYLRCHNLVWYNQLPSYITSGSWTNETLIAALKEHINGVVTHWKGQCYAWDVVNEALNEDGTYRQNVFYQHIGEAYIPIAFAAAAAADPNAKLYYNDYNIEYPGAKATGAQNIVKSIQAAGARIDGVGLQAHFIVGQTPSLASQKANMAAFTALGVDVAITELDIRMTLPDTSALQTQQSTDYQTTTTACVQTKGCVGITLWDFTDKHSWVPGTFSGQGDACPWDSNYKKKPAYYGILAGLQSGAGGSTTLTTTTTSTPTTTSSPATTTTTGAGSGTGAAHWGQCGGNGWTGPTTCVSPYTCQVVNPYYSQCL